jgi:hypothetical protein
MEMAEAIAANAEARNNRRISVIDPKLVPLLHEYRARKLDGGEIPTITTLKFVW